MNPTHLLELSLAEWNGYMDALVDIADDVQRAKTAGKR